jgi:hypothetical protein
MDENRRSHADRVLRVQLELHVDREPISGTLVPEKGPEEAFVGWLGFVDALERSREAADTQGKEPER